MLSHTERLLASAEKRKEELALEGKGIIDNASKEDRGRTPEENARLSEVKLSLDHLNKEIEEFKSQVDLDRSVLDGAKGITEPGGVSVGDLSEIQVRDRHTPAEVKKLGDQFIESKGYKELMDRGLSGQWSQQIELEGKTTLTSLPGTALYQPQVDTGVVETLFQRNFVADLCMQSTTTASQLIYVQETVATNAADATAETAAKPESTIAFGEVIEPIRKVATLLPVSDETLADAPQIRAYLNGRLSLFIANKEENELLLGSGTSPHIAGFITASRTIGTFAKSAGTSNELALLKAASGARGSSQLDPDAVVIHPSNWLAIRAGTDANGQYYGGGPFYGPYGGPQGQASSSYFSADNLWGLRVIVTSNITVGSALIGAFGVGAEVARRQGITVEASNSHSTFFANNITTLRAESRLGLKVFRPQAFVVVTGLTAG